jgi:hypothetical protein
MWTRGTVNCEWLIGAARSESGNLTMTSSHFPDIFLEEVTEITMSFRENNQALWEFDPVTS